MMRWIFLGIWAISAWAEDGPKEADFLSKVRQLTFEGKRAGEGYFNHNGTAMVFQSERLEENPFYQIYLMDLETGDVEQISPGKGKTTCAWLHPNGRDVLFASSLLDVTFPRRTLNCTPARFRSFKPIRSRPLKMVWNSS